jgi:hypothetical protein
MNVAYLGHDDDGRVSTRGIPSSFSLRSDSSSNLNLIKDISEHIRRAYIAKIYTIVWYNKPPRRNFGFISSSISLVAE